MNLSQLSVITLASSAALLIASATVSCLRELADKVEELHHMMSLISQSVTTARFRGSEHHQYFSRDGSRESWHSNFDVYLMLMCFKVNTIDIATFCSVSLSFLALYFNFFFLLPTDLVQTLMWLCFYASRFFSL